MGIFDPPNIRNLREKRDIQGLVKALKHKDPNVREMAAYALSELKDDSSAAALILALNDPIAKVRYWGAEALGEIGAPEAVQPLINVSLIDPALDTRGAAIRALGKIGDRRAVEPLCALLNAMPARNILGISGGFYFYIYLAETFEKIGDSRTSLALGSILIDETWNEWLPSGDRFSTLDVVVKATAKYADAQTVNLLLPALTSQNEWVRSNARRILSKINPTIVEAFFDIGRDDYSRFANLTILERQLIATLNNTNETLLKRHRAAELLGTIQTSQGDKTLIKNLQDENISVREACALALGGFRKPPEAVQAALRNAMKDPVPEVRAAAATSLHRLDSFDIESLASLLSGCKDNSANVQRAATQSLEKIKNGDKNLVNVLTAAQNGNLIGFCRSANKIQGENLNDIEGGRMGLKLLMAMNETDNTLAQVLQESILRVDDISGAEDTSHGGTTYSQYYGGWRETAKEFLSFHSRLVNSTA